ncbi:hypothetical protein JRO89_XS10G0094100 [Xanthoceras sorbifolium]|uniref:Biogenesis of lysosome-related organelles complex 1 subunit 2 n=1 Tax=Xanthoceras sorbifolium TaxID=99658 RepID=A0ABQ8HI59_9ROSI|nr:hypothetical protein JRO89_XS10G0094100 [Xanthoceras sorbifolium]
MAKEERRDELVESLNDLLRSVSSMVKSELSLELLKKMNMKVEEKYKGFGDFSSELRVYVEQLKSKSGGFDDYVQQIDAIENQVSHFEAVISMIEQYETNNSLELLQNMNMKVEEEYKGLGDLSSGLKVFV